MPLEELRELAFRHYRKILTRDTLLKRYTPEVADYLWALFEDIKKSAEKDLKKGGKDPQPEVQPEPVTIEESQTVH